MPETRLGRECAKIAMLRNCVYGSSHTGKNKLLLRMCRDSHKKSLAIDQPIYYSSHGHHERKNYKNPQLLLYNQIFQVPVARSVRSLESALIFRVSLKSFRANYGQFDQSLDGAKVVDLREPVLIKKNSANQERALLIIVQSGESSKESYIHPIRKEL